MKLFRMPLVLASTALFVFGCQREEATGPVAATDGIAQGHAKNIWSRAWNPDETGNGDHKCPWPGNRCQKVQMFVPGDVEVVNDVLDVIEGGNQSAIIDEFERNETVLVKYLEQGHFDAVVDREIVPTALWDIARANRFMIFGEASAAEVYELPAE